MNELYNQYIRDIPPEKWGRSRYANNQLRVMAWQNYHNKTGDSRLGDCRIPDFDTYLRENGHTVEAEKRANEQQRYKIQQEIAEQAIAEKIKKSRKDMLRVWGPYAYIDITKEELLKIKAYLRIALGMPSAKNTMGAMQWTQHGIMITTGGTQVSKMYNTPLSDYGKQIMDNIWKIVESE